MKKSVKPSAIKGSISAPASKSMMQRAIAIAAMAAGRSILYNYTPCNDSDAALEIAGKLGSKVSLDGSTVTIDGGIVHQSSTLNCGEAGLGIRMFTPIASLVNGSMQLEGEGSLKVRPVDMLEKPLAQLGVDITTTNGYVPINVKGPMKGGAAEVDGSLSSQMLTGMLLALPLAENDSTLTVADLKSKPYIDMTLEIMSDFGVEAKHDDYKVFTVAGKQAYKPTEYNVEGDWSGASFLAVAGALAGEVEINNVRKDSKQADLAIVDALERAGAELIFEEGKLIVKKKELKAYEFDATECPDLFPPLVALAAHCEGVTKIKGTSRLAHKESDRATVLKTEFEKLGVRVELEGDYMSVYGGPVKAGTMHANNDHRIAMAGAVAALIAEGTVEIENAECIAKSYPGFYDDIAKLGAQVD